MSLSAIEHVNNAQQHRRKYVPASIKVIDISTSKIICQSPGLANESAKEVDFGDGGFVEW